MKYKKIIYTVALESFKRYWVIFLVGLIILCLSSVSAYQCYQESANISTACGGLSTGNYSFTGNYYTTGAYHINNSYDGAYSTGSQAQDTKSFGMLIRYSFNSSYVPSLWRISYYNIDSDYYTDVNYTIPRDCLVNNNITMFFDGHTGTISGGHYGSFGCLNQTNNNLYFVYQESGSLRIMDEAMIFDIPSYPNYNNNTYDTAIENFNINFSISTNIISAQAILNYNNVNYPSTVICNGLSCNAANNISIPIISLSQQNNTFYWNITTYDGLSSYTATTNRYNQSVKQVSLTKCTTGNIALNFTAFEEQNITRINSFYFDGYFDYSLGGIITKNLSISNFTANEIDLCINYNITLYIDSIIAYSKSGYTIRNNFYQHYPIANNSQKVPLYLLTSDSSTSFILQVQDRNIQPIPQVLVNAQKCYTGTNTNESVFIHRTDTNGLTVGNLEAETALYQFFITNQSQTILAVTPCAKIVPQTSPYTLLFQLGGGYSSPFTNIQNNTEINSNIRWNNTNKILTWTYIDSSTTFTNAGLIVRKLNYTGNNQIYCNQNNSFSSGVITCNLTDYSDGVYSARMYIYRGYEILIDQYIFTSQSRSSEVGYYGLFLTFFLLLIGAFAFKYNEIAGIVLTNLIVIFCDFVNLANFGTVFITAMVGVSIIIIGVLER